MKQLIVWSSKMMQMIDLYDIEYSEEDGESESRRKTMNNDELTECHQLQWYNTWTSKMQVEIENEGKIQIFEPLNPINVDFLIQ